MNRRGLHVCKFIIFRGDYHATFDIYTVQRINGQDAYKLKNNMSIGNHDDWEKSFVYWLIDGW